MKLSLAITTYNRPELTLKSFEKVLGEDRIDDIVIVDDFSRQENFDKLFHGVESFSKVRLVRNQFNLGMSRNKTKAISLTKNDWVIIFDSDNVIDVDYLDALEEELFLWKWEENSRVIYCPSAALPKYNYEGYAGVSFGINQAKVWLEKQPKQFGALMNTCNYVVNKKRYLETYKHNPDVDATDTIWHNYNHLKNGGVMLVVPNMTYQHLIHDESGWRKNRAKNLEQFDKICNLIQGI